ncbi:MAG: radical SAM protein [Candidatus Eremiobacteraeota bacterium]|nr:radical SAM protein [Candidatus Eremiobacteraeota bacterium]
MKILLVALDINEETVQELATPFGLMYLASYLKSRWKGKLEISLIDGARDDIPEEADLIGISSMSRSYRRACALARKVKERRKIPLIVGGSHITALPHTLDPSFDIGVRGEGEATFLELVTLLAERGSFIPEDLAKIRGIVFREKESLRLTEDRPPPPSLEELPYPDRSLWDLTGRAKYLLSSRGCPFDCVFCAIAGSRYRFAPADYVLKELESLYQAYKPPQIVFQDDLFTVNPSRLRAIAEGIEARGLSRKVAFAVSLRADSISEETLRLLRKMNVARVFMGIESGSEGMLRYYKAGRISVEDVQRALDLCLKFGIPVEGSFIIGAPRETREDLLATYNFIFQNYKRGALDGGSINILTPYPGSHVWEYAKARGIVSDTMDFSLLNMTLNTFNPYTCLYLNEIIPLEEFIEYLEIFEDLHFTIIQKSYRTLGKSYEKLFFQSRLDRKLLERFKKEKSP